MKLRIRTAVVLLKAPTTSELFVRLQTLGGRQSALLADQMLVLFVVVRVRLIVIFLSLPIGCLFIFFKLSLQLDLDRIVNFASLQTGDLFSGRNVLFLVDHHMSIFTFDTVRDALQVRRFSDVMSRGGVLEDDNGK